MKVGTCERFLACGLLRIPFDNWRLNTCRAGHVDVRVLREVIRLAVLDVEEVIPPLLSKCKTTVFRKI